MSIKKRGGSKTMKVSRGKKGGSRKMKGGSRKKGGSSLMTNLLVPLGILGVRRLLTKNLKKRKATKTKRKTRRRN